MNRPWTICFNGDNGVSDLFDWEIWEDYDAPLEDRYIAATHSKELAEQIVADHNAHLSRATNTVTSSPDSYTGDWIH